MRVKEESDGEEEYTRFTAASLCWENQGIPVATGCRSLALYLLEDALAITFAALVLHPNLTLEPESNPDELFGGPQVKTEAVRDLDLAPSDRSLVAHSLVNARDFGRRIGRESRNRSFHARLLNRVFEPRRGLRRPLLKSLGEYI